MLSGCTSVGTAEVSAEATGASATTGSESPSRLCIPRSSSISSGWMVPEEALRWRSSKRTTSISGTPGVSSSTTSVSRAMSGILASSPGAPPVTDGGTMLIGPEGAPPELMPARVAVALGSGLLGSPPRATLLASRAAIISFRVGPKSPPIAGPPARWRARISLI